MVASRHNHPLMSWLRRRPHGQLHQSYPPASCSLHKSESRREGRERESIGPAMLPPEQIGSLDGPCGTDLTFGSLHLEELQLARSVATCSRTLVVPTRIRLTRRSMRLTLLDLSENVCLDTIPPETPGFLRTLPPMLIQRAADARRFQCECLGVLRRTVGYYSLHPLMSTLFV